MVTGSDDASPASRRMWERLFELGGCSAIVAVGPEMTHWVESVLGTAPLAEVPTTGSFETVVVDLTGDAEQDVDMLQRIRRVLVPGRSRVWAFLFGDFPDWSAAQDVIHRSGFSEARLVEPSPQSLAIRLVPEPPPLF